MVFVLKCQYVSIYVLMEPCIFDDRGYYYLFLSFFYKDFYCEIKLLYQKLV